MNTSSAQKRVGWLPSICSVYISTESVYKNKRGCEAQSGHNSKQNKSVGLDEGGGLFPGTHRLKSIKRKNWNKLLQSSERQENHSKKKE